MTNLNDEDVNDNYDIAIDEDYGKKMTDELEGAIQGLMDLSYQEFSSEEGAEYIQAALQAAEEAPEATFADNYRRKARTGDLTESESDSLENLIIDELEKLYRS